MTRRTFIRSIIFAALACVGVRPKREPRAEKLERVSHPVVRAISPVRVAVYLFYRADGQVVVISDSPATFNPSCTVSIQ